MDQVQEIFKQAESFFNGFIDTGSKYVAEGIATGLGTANDALKQAKGFASAELSWVAEEAQKAEAIALDYTHQGVAIAAKYPEYTQAAGVAGGILLLPWTRRALINTVVRMVRSEEAVFRSAEIRIESMAKRIEELKMESQKLQERYVSAEQELLSGRKKVEAVASQIESLGKDIRKGEAKLEGVLSSLGSIKGQEAAGLRAKARGQATSLASQKGDADSMLRRAMKVYYG